MTALVGWVQRYVSDQPHESNTSSQCKAPVANQVLSCENLTAEILRFTCPRKIIINMLEWIAVFIELVSRDRLHFSQLPTMTIQLPLVLPYS